MINRYQIIHQGITAWVEAEREGEGRFMVRLSIPGKLAPLRIGCVLGGNKRWKMEAQGIGGNGIKVTDSLKSACTSLAEYAVSQGAIKPYFEEESVKNL